MPHSVPLASSASLGKTPSHATDSTNPSVNAVRQAVQEAQKAAMRTFGQLTTLFQLKVEAIFSSSQKVEVFDAQDTGFLTSLYLKCNQSESPFASFNWLLYQNLPNLFQKTATLNFRHENGQSQLELVDDKNVSNAINIPKSSASLKMLKTHQVFFEHLASKIEGQVLSPVRASLAEAIQVQLVASLSQQLLSIFPENLSKEKASAILQGPHFQLEAEVANAITINVFQSVPGQDTFRNTLVNFLARGYASQSLSQLNGDLTPFLLGGQGSPEIQRIGRNYIKLQEMAQVAQKTASVYANASNMLRVSDYGDSALKNTLRSWTVYVSDNIGISYVVKGILDRSEEQMNKFKAPGFLNELAASYSRYIKEQQIIDRQLSTMDVVVSDVFNLIDTFAGFSTSRYGLITRLLGVAKETDFNLENKQEATLAMVYFLFEGKGLFDAYRYEDKRGFVRACVGLGVNLLDSYLVNFVVDSFLVPRLLDRLSSGRLKSVLGFAFNLCSRELTRRFLQDNKTDLSYLVEESLLGSADLDETQSEGLSREIADLLEKKEK